MKFVIRENHNMDQEWEQHVLQSLHYKQEKVKEEFRRRKWTP